MNEIELKVEEYTPENADYSFTTEIITKIVKAQDTATIKAITKFCREYGYFPNILIEEQVEEILRLGIAEYERRQLEEGNSNE